MKVLGTDINPYNHNALTVASLWAPAVSKTGIIVIMATLKSPKLWKVPRSSTVVFTFLKRFNFGCGDDLQNVWSLQVGATTTSFEPLVVDNDEFWLTMNFSLHKLLLRSCNLKIYLLDIYIFYTIISAVCGFLLGARDRLGEIRSLGAVHKLFEKFPEAFMDTLHVPLSNREMDLLLMPKNTGNLPMVQWPLFLLGSKIFLAKDIAIECKDSQEELWDRISRDDYMKYAVEECYCAVRFVLTAILDDEGKMWVERVYEDIQASIGNRTIHVDFELNKLSLVISRVTALMGIL
ncbi:hypothetical protein U1Q18_047373, partial [Sarracenia purpurea var. burkii]